MTGQVVRHALNPSDRSGDAHERGWKPVQVVDINFFGCLIKLSEPGFSIADHARDCTLYMESPELKLELLVFDYDDAGYLRCLFKHGNIQAAERFTELLKNSEYFLHQDSEGNVHRIYG